MVLMGEKSGKAFWEIDCFSRALTLTANTNIGWLLKVESELSRLGGYYASIQLSTPASEDGCNYFEAVFAFSNLLEREVLS